MWTTRTLDDKADILSFLEADRGYAAYAIGDLDVGFYEQCTWAGAAREGCIEALILHYRGLEPAPLLLMGEREGLRAILRETLAPERVYLTCRPEALDLTRAFYAWEAITPMWRMILDPGRAPPAHPSPEGVQLARLGPAGAARINALFAGGGGLSFHPDQVEQGVFYGVLAEGALVAVAGTHLVSDRYGVAAIGNVYTHPDYRGHGHATLTTGAVADALQRRGIGTIALNVSQANAAAIHVYEKLGFARYCPFLEGPATRGCVLQGRVPQGR
jgi:GNAT superfamily N-acetyltransferase